MWKNATLKQYNVKSNPAKSHMSFHHPVVSNITSPSSRVAISKPNAPHYTAQYCCPKDCSPEHPPRYKTQKGKKREEKKQFSYLEVFWIRKRFNILLHKLPVRSMGILDNRQFYFWRMQFGLTAFPSITISILLLVYQCNQKNCNIFVHYKLRS